MHKWKWKALAQKGISFLPFKYRINTLFQRYLTRGLVLTEAHFTDKLTVAGDHIRYLRHYLPEKTEAVCLELGTGWYPIVPLALYLSDCGEIHTLDIASHLKKANLLLAMERLLGLGEENLREKHIPRLNEARFRQLQELHAQASELGLADLLHRLRIYPLLGDARKLAFPDRTFDLICSNNTFEHIYPEVLKAILGEFHRVLKDDGIMSHFIDMTDHFEHFDKSITIYNFLRYSEKAWSRIDNAIQPQNRLRFPDYQDLYHATGFAILEEATRPGDLEALRRVPLAEPFRSYAPEELAISHAHLVGFKYQTEA